MRERHSLGAELWNTVKLGSCSPLPINTIHLTNCESTLAKFHSLTCRRWSGLR